MNFAEAVTHPDFAYCVYKNSLGGRKIAVFLSAPTATGVRSVIEVAEDDAEAREYIDALGIEVFDKVPA